MPITFMQRRQSEYFPDLPQLLNYGDGDMKKLRLAACFMSVMLLLSACAPVPENVQNDVDELSKAHEEEKQLSKELNYIKVDELCGSTPRTFEYKNGILNINARVCVPQAEHMYKLALEPNDLYKEKENASKLLPDGGACVAGETQQIKWDIAPDEVVSYNGIEQKSFGSKGKYYAAYGSREISISHCGELFIYNCIKHDSDEHFIPFNCSAENEYFYNEIDGNFNQSVNFGGETYNALDSWKEFQKNTGALKLNVPGFNYKPYFLGIYKASGEAEPLWAVSCHAAYEYKGVCFDTMLCVNQSVKNYDISRVDFGFYQSFHCPQDDCFMTLRNSYNVTKELEKHDEILDLDSAVKILQNNLAKERFSNIDTVELMYGMYYYGDKGADWMNNYETPPDFFAEPFWKFREKNGDDSFTVHYINAFNGDFYSYSQCVYGG